MNIKLRRSWHGQDSYGAFLEEVAINPNTYELAYRRSSGGNCEYGEWEEWKNEKRALEFMLGPITVPQVLRTHLFITIWQLPDLKEANLSTSSGTDVNYGEY